MDEISHIRFKQVFFSSLKVASKAATPKTNRRRSLETDQGCSVATSATQILLPPTLQLYTQRINRKACQPPVMVYKNQVVLSGIAESCDNPVVHIWPSDV